jgi:hypothetical protein
VVSVAFDTLEYAKELEAAGFSEKQAEVQAKALARIVDEKLASKQDISLLQRDIKELEERLKRDIKELEERLTYRLTLRMGTMLVAAVGVIAALVKIL